MTAQFGPSALATPANLLTVTRLVLTVPLLAMILRDGATWSALVLWIVLCVTDVVDGHLARRHGTTRSGAFLDPLADKVLVLGGLVALVANDMVPALPVVLIAVRELGVQALRSYWGKRGLAIPATNLAKAKTFAQEIAVGFALAPPTAERTVLVEGLLWIAVAMTLVSGYQYVQAGSRLTTTAGSR